LRFKTYFGEDDFKPKSNIYLSKISLSLNSWNGLQHGEGVASEGSWGWPKGLTLQKNEKLERDRRRFGLKKKEKKKRKES
jgi:hypothetical protein